MICHQTSIAHEPQTIPPGATVEEAAQIMDFHQVDFLAVVSGKRAIGVITDRDIALRGFKHGNPYITVDRIMSSNLAYVNENCSIDFVARAMAYYGVRRLLVQDSQGDFAGVVSLEDVALFRVESEL